MGRSSSALQHTNLCLDYRKLVNFSLEFLALLPGDGSNRLSTVGACTSTRKDFILANHLRGFISANSEISNVTTDKYKFTRVYILSGNLVP